VDLAARGRRARPPTLDPVEQHVIAAKAHVVGMDGNQRRAADDLDAGLLDQFARQSME
jgi:hypothetical protein